MAPKDKKKNYNSGKRSVSYIAKTHKAPDAPSNTLTPSSNQESVAQQELEPSSPESIVQATRIDQPQPAVPSYGKLTKQVMMKLYYACPCHTLVSENIKQLKDVYNEETIVPESFKEFTLPMYKSIMPPRRVGPSSGYQDSKTKYGEFRDARRSEENEGNIDDDQGIIAPADDNSHSAISNAPSWFDSEIQPNKNMEVKGRQEEFMWEDLANRQVALEEEKMRFNKEVKKGEAAGQVKVDIESIFNKIEGEMAYSSVDEKFEKIAQASKIERELFANATDTPNLNGLNINAIDGETLEAQMIKNAKLEPEDEGEEKPAWGEFSAEEIKQHTQKHIDDWGLTLDQNKDALLKPNSNKAEIQNDEGMMGVYESKPIMREASVPVTAKFREEPRPEIYSEPIKTESKNPFCHSSLNIKETDRVWYYEDTQRSVQGPFTSIEMYMWHKAGYFFSELPLRCGEYANFTSLGEFLSSIQTKIKSRVEALPMQHFDSSNMNAFFDASYGYHEVMRPAMRTSPPLASPTMSLEEIERSQFRPEYRYPEPQYRAPFTLERTHSEQNQWRPYSAAPIGRYPPQAHMGVQPGYYQNYQGYEQPMYAGQKPYAGRGQYFEEDPAIASARVGAPAEQSQPLQEGAYVADEANDLKALLGMQNNSNKALYR